MKPPGLVTAHHNYHYHHSTPTSNFLSQFCVLARTTSISHLNSNAFLRPSSTIPISLNPPIVKPSRWITLCSSIPPKSSDVLATNQYEETQNFNNDLLDVEDNSESRRLNVEVRQPNMPPYVSQVDKLSLSDRAFFLLAFIACTTSVAFTSLVIAAVPTLYAMGRAAISLSKLADTATKELPSTMAAIRLSGMEISDLTLELSDLSQEITDGVNKSTQAVQAAEAGIRQIGSFAREQTMSMIQERANLPIISLQPVVAGAAKKTSRAVGQARKTLMSIISRGEFSLENDDSDTVDRLES
ncbi:uncharacterized protein LOC132271380 [Cornus florida]|uniref:uncharacterized protein LOC132271380 n=1 Tax=Cornus florida TaxID=4283 RepID=UPI00289E3819|nr:uncharacterized protein LOC132271380 [Cornus florida]